jgi:hypothetical protein
VTKKEQELEIVLQLSTHTRIIQTRYLLFSIPYCFLCSSILDTSLLLQNYYTGSEIFVPSTSFNFNLIEKCSEYKFRPHRTSDFMSDILNKINRLKKIIGCYLKFM